MQKFNQFISEGAMSASFLENRGPRQVKNYVLPYLNSAGRAKTVKAFSNSESSALSKVDASSHGEKYDPKASSTHVLEKEHNGHAAGTPIKITHVTHENSDKIIAHTESHGAIPLSKISKPKELAKPAQGNYGFEVETKVAKNLGLKQNAGSSNVDRDFEIHGAKAKVKVVPDKEEPIVRGESKLEQGRMGVTSLKYTPHPTKKGKGSWGFTGQDRMVEKFPETQIKGPDGKHRPLLDHLNKFHADGNFRQGTSAPAPSGTARHYLSGKQINVLHIHDKKTKNSTTYTIGDTSLKGKTGLGHLSHKDIDKMDGTVSLEPAGKGRIRIAHSPNTSVMRQYASAASENPTEHKTLENKKHADEFKAGAKKHAEEWAAMPEKKRAAITAKRFGTKKLKQIKEEIMIEDAPANSMGAAGISGLGTSTGGVAGFDPAIDGIFRRSQPAMVGLNPNKYRKILTRLRLGKK